MSKYPIIIFEGIETSGKTTNFNIAVNYLKKKKKSFIKLREPGGSIFSEKIRKLILNKKLNLNSKTDLLLFYASRSENFEKIIKKNYKKRIILIDRFTDSTIAYQHFGMKLDLNIIKMLNKFVIGNFNPDLVFLSTVNSINLKKRLKKRSTLNRYDKFKLNFYSKVQNGYEKISRNKKRYIKINSNKNSINDVKNIIINKLEKII
ncbi:dTMP kinase [Candidatus Pelagibacter sp.]|nr:dTMP kinase [Candidatus Pelagibacter sp.]